MGAAESTETEVDYTAKDFTGSQSAAENGVSTGDIPYTDSIANFQLQTPFTFVPGTPAFDESAPHQILPPIQGQVRAARSALGEQPGADPFIAHDKQQAKWNDELKYWMLFDPQTLQYIDTLPEEDLRNPSVAEQSQLRQLAQDWYGKRSNGDPNNYNPADYSAWTNTTDGYQELLRDIQSVKQKLCKQHNGFSAYDTCNLRYPLGNSIVSPTQYVDGNDPTTTTDAYTMPLNKVYRW